MHYDFDFKPLFCGHWSKFGKRLFKNVIYFFVCLFETRTCLQTVLEKIPLTLPGWDTSKVCTVNMLFTFVLRTRNTWLTVRVGNRCLRFASSNAVRWRWMTEFSLSLVPVEYICSNVHELVFSFDEGIAWVFLFHGTSQQRLLYYTRGQHSYPHCFIGLQRSLSTDAKVLQ